ncbi:kinase-like protein [Fistulina hepatica ATCC 64428]|uniref:non-specific serine/threonine protein kinase n=1 Tax=Fistulina hepatica ATCC 64428 TaxID=1128425 RepID=A0A0D7A679_9AGAR|nr:kinase-like protein [Fistulina hepatica ATCC 64428]
MSTDPSVSSSAEDTTAPSPSQELPKGTIPIRYEDFTFNGIYPDKLETAVFQNRYHLQRQLGQGWRSLVWLANDVQEKCDVALKILSAEETAEQGTGNFREREALQIIDGKAKISPHDGLNYILTMRDAFFETDVKGRYLVMVSEVLGESLRVRLQQRVGRAVPMEYLRFIMKQLIMALDFIHDVCDIVHTDIRSENIVFLLDTADVDLDDEKAWRLKLIDFGYASTPQGDREAMDVQPRQVRAPEVFIGCPWGTPIDIWNLGCLTFELASGYNFVPPMRNIDLDDSYEYQIAYYEKIIGDKFSDYLDFYQNGKEFNKLLKSDGSVLRGFNNLEPLPQTLEMFGIDDPLFVDFVHCMLRLLPSARHTAKQLLSHPWLVAEPEAD